MSPNLVAAEVRETQNLVNSRNFELASKRASDLVTRFPSLAAAPYLLAQAQYGQGNLTGAVISAECACKLEPTNFEYNYLCGKLFNAAKRSEHAIPYLEKSVTHMPNAAASQFELGNAFFQLGMLPRAIPYFRTALKLSPPDQLKVNIRDYLSQALRDTGNVAEAIIILRRLASEKTEFAPHALLSLIELESPLPGSKLAKEIDAQRERPGNSAHTQRLLWLATGRYLLNANQHDAAFAAWQNAAEAGKREAWIPKNHDWFLQSTKAFYNADLFSVCAPFAHESDAPVFIAGMPRSGTTLTEKLIAAHSQAGGVGELTRWQSLDRAFRNEYAGPGGKEKLFTNMQNCELKKRAEELLFVFKTILGTLPPRVVEKWPQNYLNAGLQALLFRNARFIHVRRHPADTFVSTYQNNFAVTDAFALDQVEFAREYVMHEKLMDHWKSLFGARILSVQYETLVSNPEPEARRIIDFLAMPWEDQCLRFYERQTTVRTFSTQQVRKPINTASVDRWRVYEPHLGVLFKTLQDLGWQNTAA